MASGGARGGPPWRAAELDAPRHGASWSSVVGNSCAVVDVQKTISKRARRPVAGVRWTCAGEAHAAERVYCPSVPNLATDKLID